MSNIWKRLFIGLLIVNIVGIIAFAIVLDVFDQSGIHILGDYAHVTLREDCYFIEREGDEYTASEKSTLVVSGYLVNEHFSGYINVEAFPAEPYEGYADNFIGHTEWGKRVLLTNHNDDFPGHETRNHYIVRIQKANPELVIVDITDVNGKSFTAVCANSPEEAIANYQAFLDSYFD